MLEEAELQAPEQHHVLIAAGEGALIYHVHYWVPGPDATMKLLIP